MSIIYSLAGCDQNNCVEIDRVTDLIPKIIGFTSFKSAMVNSEAQQKVLLMSSLKVLQRLTSIEGEIGITLSSDVDCLLPKVDGQALVMLSSENPHNCFVMILIHDDKYIYVAASLLHNMCLHVQHELTESDCRVPNRL
uniref:Uncharacterized protein n=1 Tax=Oryza meridionalis TaxID=40149 RepID=A0A0E0EFD4_9ORYZ